MTKKRTTKHFRTLWHGSLAELRAKTGAESVVHLIVLHPRTQPEMQDVVFSYSALHGLIMEMIREDGRGQKALRRFLDELSTLTVEGREDLIDEIAKEGG